jgi:hypothetical protein
MAIASFFEDPARVQVKIVANLHLPKPGKFREVSIFLKMVPRAKPLSRKGLRK